MRFPPLLLFQEGCEELRKEVSRSVATAAAAYSQPIQFVVVSIAIYSNEVSIFLVVVDLTCVCTCYGRSTIIFQVISAC